jgi:DNA-binding transcriptional LysR family regulator
VDIESLKLFCDVIRLKSFTQAGAANSITQSAVSQRLKAFEKGFGVPLLERRGSELRLTAAGEVVHRGAKRILAELREIEEHLQEIRGQETGSVRVATIYSVGLYELDPFVKRFLKTHPNVQVQVEYSRANKIYQDVISGSIDLGIVAYPASKPQISSIPFSRDELVLICPPGHPLSQQATVNLKRLNGQPFVAFERDIPTRREADAVLRNYGASPIVKAEFDNIELIKSAVEIGLGVSLVPSVTVKSEIQAGLLHLAALAEGPFMRPIAVIYRRGRSLPPAAKKFITVLTETRR